MIGMRRGYGVPTERSDGRNEIASGESGSTCLDARAQWRRAFVAVGRSAVAAAGCCGVHLYGRAADGLVQLGRWPVPRGARGSSRVVRPPGSRPHIRPDVLSRILHSTARQSAAGGGRSGSSPEIREVQTHRPLFITGLPRTGTTLLHRQLSLAPGARSLAFWETLEPSPPPEAATAHTDPRIRRARRTIRNLEARMVCWLDENPQGKHGAHRYGLAEFGLDRATISRLFARYRAGLATDVRPDPCTGLSEPASS
jgi:Sulfotransferase family